MATDPSHSTTVGDAHWDEGLSPYMPVGMVTLPKQTVQPRSATTDKIVFNPWNMLAAHRPVGIIQRARYYVYKTHSGERQAAMRCPVLATG